MFQYPQKTGGNPLPISQTGLFFVVSCPEWSGSVAKCNQVAPNMSASVRNRPFLSEIRAKFVKVSASTISFARWHVQCYMYTPATTMSTIYLYRHALEKLAAEPATTKTALLRSLLSDIEAALRSGKTHKQVWQRLSEAGLDITCETFCRLIRRARKKPRISAPPGGKSTEVPALDAQQTEKGVKHDPLVNFRRLEASRPGFHYRAGGDLDELVHGRRESREQRKR